MTDRPPPGDVTHLLAALSDGQPDALDALLPVVYGELRRQAARYLRRVDEALHQMQEFLEL